METKLPEAFCERIRRKMGMENSMYVNPSGTGGGQAWWWINEVSIDYGHISKNIINSVDKVRWM